MSSTELNPDLENLLEYIKRNRGFDFSGYKRTSLTRRIHKRMQSVRVQSYSDYLDYLEVHPDEFVDLFNTILINVTTFFRDPQAWEYIASEIIPQIIASKQPTTPVRVWSAGCASGEESYTIAILLAEALGIEEYTARVKVFATDVDVDAINYARQAHYNSKQVENVPPHLVDKYFERVNGRYLVQKELRRGVIFGRHDLVQDAPISKIDLLICRNTIMYFNTETQAKILARFHFALNNNGFLFLGKAEMLFSRNHSYTTVDLRERVFTKLGHGSMRDLLLNIAHSKSQQVTPEMIDKLSIYEAGFEVDPLAQIVVDSNSIVILANAEARNLFNLNLKDIGRPLQDLELSYRPVDLRSPIDQVRSNHRIITLKEVEWSIAEREIRYLDVQFTPLLDENIDELIGIKIIFIDVTRFKQLQHDLVHANQELETAYEELQSTNEELETTNEELQSTVEELETTNEELQSTNEELETMNEELQSTNEELQTINEELRQRSDELNQANSFLESILTSLRVGVVVLNPDLQILIWNRKAEDMWGLRFDEVFSKQFISLDINLPIQPLLQPLRAIISGESQNYEVVLNAINRRGRAIACQVICTPLYSNDLDIKGVILVMEQQQQQQQ
ncbi:MCP methyltransferase, CheR-type with PAS/PAC sensor [Scytonema sp. HK-05]|uniref:CheR family methyltransferase n=1 Tax=Scytonema sp. HK-05 TaxID=1137095 RepID=UPI0009372770|nr:CheR family methyltransferase [Scytonema sp. HK-05]OKH61068.1 chemotaxis protein CheR [Scytonema sp. HK-05]BAY46467.1 MCP methyltransferase, CheR-type with PAS/PAC sensor [Scytonema sp. HK-05]